MRFKRLVLTLSNYEKAPHVVPLRDPSAGAAERARPCTIYEALALSELSQVRLCGDCAVPRQHWHGFRSSCGPQSASVLRSRPLDLGRG
jgi:hypothetical protein